ncbi:hypothetical protein [Flagellimonas sp. S3867]|uniref:hypothetical protein n=1 Tax=Flagellimonas sp. S3867 TaxID=2768063 RepID=UPI00168A2036|nr:hypothetical protein [Flagellimonas sp. S3867]
MRYKIMTLWIAFSFSCINAQVSTTEKETTKDDRYWNNLEYVYVYHNTSLLFAGEHFLYSVYSLIEGTDLPSSFSKIAYVEMVSEDGQVLFRQKLRLDNGLGQGDFFVPANTPSGNYKLLGYTKWMKNSGINCFFQSDVGIINPFQNNQDAILGREVVDTETRSGQDKTKQNKRSGVEGITLTMDKSSYNRRKQAVLTINATNESVINGNYSISIRKSETIRKPLMPSAQRYVNTRKVDESNQIESKLLPEIRGELISGKITPNESNISLSDEKMALSIPGEQFKLKLTRTNEKGDFFFNINQAYENDQVFIQVLGKNRNNYKIELNSDGHLDYEKLEFEKLIITPKMNDLILERNIYNQVENAFAEIKPDNIVTEEPIIPVYRQFSKVYNLDDYTRFPTIRETMLEVVDNVWVAKNADGEDEFQVREDEDNKDFNLPPLVLVDGILIQQHNDIIDNDARDINKIKVSRKECVVNAIVYKGIIAIETIKGDFYKNYSKDYIRIVDLAPPLPSKRYFNQRYGGEEAPLTNQFPDFRHQLLWIPRLDLQNGKINIDFFTSDVPGNYEIYLEGFTATGKPVSIRKTLEVK